MAPYDKSKYLPLAEATRQFGLRDSTLRSLVNRKAVDSKKLGDLPVRLVSLASLTKYLEQARPNEGAPLQRGRPVKPENAGKPRRGESGRKRGRPRKETPEDKPAVDDPNQH